MTALGPSAALARIATSTVVAVASMIAFAEINRLVGAALSADGASRTFSDVFGPGIGGAGAAWEVWATSEYLAGDVGSARPRSRRGATGIRASALDVATTGWLDRAALMERSWEQSSAVLTRPIDTELDGPAGTLVLNSAAAGPGCRVIISEVAFAPVPRQPACTASLVAPSTADLVALYGSCTPTVPAWSTAVMLSARFPSVTPAGRVPACDTSPVLQLVDGGYAEGSGLGTLNDLAPQIVAALRDHNTTATGTRERPHVVPVVLYLLNGPGGDVVGAQPPLTAELFVPYVDRAPPACRWAAPRGCNGSPARWRTRVPPRPPHATLRSTPCAANSPAGSW